MKRLSLYIIVLLTTLSHVEAKLIQSSLASGKISKRVWRTSMTGTITCDSHAAVLTSGPKEESVRLSLKKKVNPDDYYQLEAEIFPTKKNSDGYAAFVTGPGWMLLCGDDGRFWVVSQQASAQPTSSNPLDTWYGVKVINRPGVTEITVKNNETNKIVGKWFFFKDSGFSGRIAFGAVTGTGRKGPREMKVRNVKLNILPEKEFLKIPESFSDSFKDQAKWSLEGDGKITVSTQNMSKELTAKLKTGGKIFYKFNEPCDLSKIHSVKLGIKTSTADKSYNIQYAFVSKNGGIIYYNELSKSGSFDWENKVFYPDMMSSFNNPDISKIVGFYINSIYFEKPAEIRLKNFQINFEKENQNEHTN